MNPHNASSDTYNRGIVPVETTARKEREGENYKETPDDGEESLDIRGGYTVSSEGLSNNYAIDPKMYIETPGDLRQEEKATAAARAETRREANQTSEQGKLTVDNDDRGKGVGII